MRMHLVAPALAAMAALASPAAAQTDMMNMTCADYLALDATGRQESVANMMQAMPASGTAAAGTAPAGTVAGGASGGASQSGGEAAAVTTSKAPLDDVMLSRTLTGMERECAADGTVKAMDAMGRASAM